MTTSGTPSGPSRPRACGLDRDGPLARLDLVPPQLYAVPPVRWLPRRIERGIRLVVLVRGSGCPVPPALHTPSGSGELLTVAMESSP